MAAVRAPRRQTRLQTRRPARRRVTAAATATVAIVAAVATGTAFAAWTTPAAARSGTVQAGTLGAPATVQATANGREVRVTWTAVTPSPTGYRVERGKPNGEWGEPGTGCRAVGRVTICVDESVNGNQWFYRVAAVQGAWRGAFTATATPVKVNGPPGRSAAGPAATTAPHRDVPAASPGPAEPAAPTAAPEPTPAPTTPAASATPPASAPPS